MKKAETFSAEEPICHNCKHALKRSHFSFEKYGDRGCSWECCLMDDTAGMYKHSDDTCDKFLKKEILK